MNKKKRIILTIVSLIINVCVCVGTIYAYQCYIEKKTTCTFDVTMYCYEVSMSGVPLGECEPFQLTGRSRWWTTKGKWWTKQRKIELEAWSVDSISFPTQYASIYKTLSDEAFTLHIGTSKGVGITTGSMIGLTESFDCCVIYSKGRYFVGSADPDFDVEDVLVFFPDLPTLIPYGR